MAVPPPGGGCANGLGGAGYRSAAEEELGACHSRSASKALESVKLMTRALKLMTRVGGAANF